MVLDDDMAEKQGFEPWVELPPQRFSRPSRSAAPALLRGGVNVLCSHPGVKNSMTMLTLPGGGIKQCVFTTII